MLPYLLRYAHRLIGLFVVLPVLLLVVTGLPLQFTNALQLGKLGIQATWLHRAYGIKAPMDVLTSNGVTQIGDIAVVANRPISLNGTLCGVLVQEQLTVVLSSAEVVLVPTHLDIPVERNVLNSVPLRCGVSSAGALVLDLRQGQQSSMDIGVTWLPSLSTDVQWYQVSTQPISKQHEQVFGASKLSWERWLQDLHSGRFFGDLGVWIMSFAGLALVVLGLSGVMIWFASRRPPAPPR